VYLRPIALLLGGFALAALLSAVFAQPIGLAAEIVVFVAWIVVSVILGIASGAHARAIEVIAGLVGVVAGASTGVFLGPAVVSGPGNRVINAIAVSMMFSGLPFLLGAIPKYVIAREQVEIRRHPAIQAPAGSVCGRCGKPLSPYWRGKCGHCGAAYDAYPPVQAGAKRT
jgi:hypothetical protein